MTNKFKWNLKKRREDMYNHASQEARAIKVLWLG